LHYFIWPERDKPGSFATVSEKMPHKTFSGRIGRKSLPLEALRVEKVPVKRLFGVTRSN
jgi:hypothetical protein